MLIFGSSAAMAQGTSQLPFLLKRLDQNGDGKVSEQEYLARHVEEFRTMDKNSDGQLSADEFIQKGKALREQFSKPTTVEPPQ